MSAADYCVDTNVGLVGFGLMGSAITARFRSRGLHVAVFARSKDEATKIRAEGGRPVTSFAELTASTATICLSLPTEAAVANVLLGVDGILESSHAGTVVVDTSTIHPKGARMFADEACARDCAYLDAPVSGGPAAATDGRLTLMVGGSMLAFQKVEPLLRSLGTTVVWMGGPGSGQVAKACNQLVVAANIEAVAEALVLAKKCGLDPARVRMALEGGFAGSAALTIHGSRMLRHDFEPGARAALHVKDADIFESLSREAGVPIPLGAAARVALHSLAKSGKGDLDHSALVLPLEEASGCSVEADAEPT